MAELNTSSSPRCVKPGALAGKKGVKTGQSQPFRLHTEQRGQMKEQALVKKLQDMEAQEGKNRIPVAQPLPLTTDKPQVLPKPLVKEQTKPLNIKLHTQQRAARRAGYNDLVANKLYSLELLRKFEDKIQKVIEEEEIRLMRKEMVPKAQLMPIFDRPFYPQRSTRPPTVPKEPRVLTRKCWSSNDSQRFQHSLQHNMNAIK